MIDGLQDAETIVGPILWHDFRTIRRLCWQVSSSNADRYQLETTLASEARVPACELTVIFDGVQDFRLSGFGARDSWIVGFEISEIGERQWESLNWEVGDFENDAIHFFCHEVRIASARLLP